ncbi:hypothetical protein SALBM311S_00369 [Streptomyces alboniger]
MESGAATRGTKTRAKGGQSPSNQRKARGGTTAVDTAALNRLMVALVAMRDGNFRKRLTVTGDGPLSEIAAVFNEVADRNLHLTGELARVRRMVGREGKLTERLETGACEGSWAAAIDNSNALVDDLARPVSEVGRVLSAVAEGDLSPRMELRTQVPDGAGHPLRGEFLRVGRTVNNLVDQLSTFTDEVTRVASEVGTEGKLGGQARVRGMSGSWKDLTESVNTMAYRLTAQVRDIALVTTAVAKGDLSRKVTVHVEGEMLELKNTVNTMVDQLSSFSSEVTRVAREVGVEGELGGQAQVPGVAGVWKDLTDSVNLMAGNLTAQVRGIAQVTTAVANGDLSQKVTVSARGEVAQLADTINQMTETLRIFADEVTRVANEVGAEGQLGGQANVPGAAGTWKDLTDSVNTVFRNLTTQVRDIAAVTTAVANGDLSQKVTVDVAGEMLELKNTVNGMVDQLSAFGAEVTRVAREVGVEGELGGQAQVPGAAGTWKDLTDSVNTAFRNLTGQVRNIAQVTTAVANGDLSQKVTVDVSGEMLQLKNTVNTMVDQLSAFADQVTRMARDVGTEGRLGGQAVVPGVSGTWKELTDSVNFMGGNLTSQVRQIAQVTTAVARGDLSQKIDVDARGEILELKNTINTMVDQLSAFADQVTRVAREVGTAGQLGGQAQVPGVAGVWRDLTDSVNGMASNLTGQVRNIAQVATAVARGDLSQKITVDARGEILELKNTLNTMVDQLSSFAEEVTRVAREVGTEGILGGQAEVQGVSGTWKDLTQSVNFMANNLTIQVRNIAEVTTAVAKGDLSKKITVDARGEILELVTTVNTMVDQLSSFAEQVTRVAREVGTEGILGGQAHASGVTGIWKDLTDNVNLMANNLTVQVRNISQVAAAVANGDLTRTVTIEARGEVAQLADTFNTMVKTLSSFADQVTKVAREVGTDGILGGQARVPGVAGTWKDLTESVNQMASNLTGQVRNIAMVTTAIAKGDLTKKIDIDARGEILELKTTINTMVDQLSSFAEEVTRVAREVGTEGQLGGQARVRDVDGTWRDLTESVNEMAGNLTRQVRAIARVATAVTRGDLNLKIDVDASGEIQELQDYINKMIANLRDTTIANKEQDWLKGNLARISALMQGRRDLADVASLIMSELTPVVSAQHRRVLPPMPLLDGKDIRARRGRVRTAHARVVRLLDGLHADVVPAGRGAHRDGRPGEAHDSGGERAQWVSEDLLRSRGGAARTSDRPSGAVRGAGARSHRVGLLHSLYADSEGFPQPDRRDDRDQRQHHLRQHQDRGAAEAVAGAHRATARAVGRVGEPAEGSPGIERRTRGEGRAAGPAEPGHRGQEHRDRGGAPGPGGARRAARRVDALQERVPREHVARAADAAQLAADPGQAARRQRRRESLPEAGRVRGDDPRGRFRPAPADQRHPGPVEGRGGQDGRLADAYRAGPARGLRGGHLPAADRGEGPGMISAAGTRRARSTTSRSPSIPGCCAPRCPCSSSCT